MLLKVKFEGITTETCIGYDYITIMERTCLSTTNHKRPYLRVIASSNLCPSSMCFGICWYPSVYWHLKLHLVCSLLETNCHTTLSVKRASSAALDPNRTNQETDEVGLALLTGWTTFWPQRFHAIGRCTLQSFVNRKNSHVQVLRSGRAAKQQQQIRRPHASCAKNVQHQLTDCIVCVKLW